MSTFVKICGLRSEEDVRTALGAGADAIGLVCVETSPRHVPCTLAVDLAALALSLGGTPVFVTTRRSDVHYALRDGVVPPGAWVQMHGGEDAEEVRWIAGHTGARVIKALPVAERADLTAAQDFDAADQFLLDAKPPKGADRSGGHGRTFDWSLLAGWNAPKPWILSGGLTPENVGQAIRATGATGVDVSSGVESVLGVKDPLKIRLFIREARAAFASGAAA